MKRLARRLADWLGQSDYGYFIGMALACLLVAFAVTGLIVAASPALAQDAPTGLHLECYSGGVLIFESEGTGEVVISEGVITVKSYNGWEFLHLTGDCLVRPPR